jgi:transposase InsO family protein
MAGVLNNHREVIAAFDFFTVPTLNFRTLYSFFVIEHRRRRILHFNCTEYPTANGIVQQLREALPLPCPYRYVLFDRDAKFGTEIFAFLKASGIEPVRTSLRSPWQNGIAERWVGSARPSCWIMSSHLTNNTSDGLVVSIWRIITKTERTSRWIRAHLVVGWLRHV